MEYKKAKWEREFEALKGLDIKAEIESLQPQKDEEGFIIKRVGLEGEAKLKKLQLFEKNKGQIDNLIAYRNRKREKLEKLLEAQKKQQNDVKNRESVKAESKKIEEEHKAIVEKLVELDSKIKSCKDETEKAKLETERKTVETARIKNDDEYIANQNKMSAMIGDKIDNKNYSKEIAQLRSTISKTNMICRNLFEGKSWDDIAVSLSEWENKKFTSKDEKLAEKIKAEKEERAKTENERPVRNEPQKASNNVVRKEVEEPKDAEYEEIGLTKKSKFDWRHPIKSFKDWRQRRKEEKAARVENKAEADKPEKTEKNNFVNKYKLEAEFYEKVAKGTFKETTKEQAEKAKREIEQHAIKKNENQDER